MVDITNYDVRCKSCDEIVQPEQPNNKLIIIGLGILIFGGAGVAFGSAAGLATAGAGFVLTIPLGILGVAIGYIIGSYTARLLDGITCPTCGSAFGSYIPGR